MEWSLVHLIMQLPSFHCKMPLVDMYTRKLFIKKCKKSKKTKWYLQNSLQLWQLDVALAQPGYLDSRCMPHIRVVIRAQGIKCISDRIKTFIQCFGEET